jgi:hypothetical protein
MPELGARLSRHVAHDKAYVIVDPAQEPVTHRDGHRGACQRSAPRLLHERWALHA